MALLVFYFLSISSAEEKRLKFTNSLIDQERFDFLDDKDGRVIGDVKVDLLRNDEEYMLRMTISAIGAFVQPVPGYEGIRGANRVTAEELENILSGRYRFSVENWNEKASSPVYGRFWEGARGHLPERRLLINGEIDCKASSRLDYPLEMVVEIGIPTEGVNITEFYLEGVPRLRLNFDINNDEGQSRVISFESLGINNSEGELALPMLARHKTDLILLASNDPDLKVGNIILPPIEIQKWAKHDIEGKWVLYKKETENDQLKRKHWVKFLADRSEYNLLEWIGLYERDAFKSLGVLEALEKENAPQWIRCAIWALNNPYGHTNAVAETLLIEKRPGYTFTWLKKYPAAVKGPVKNIYENLKKLSPPVRKIDKALPPLNPSRVLSFLDASKELKDFGNHAKAESGVFYVHQILRAIDGLIASGLYQNPWMKKLHSLTKHPNANVRQAAYLAYTHFPSNLIPHQEFLEVANNPKEGNKIQEAALLAFSYTDHPMAYVELHIIAAKPNHPAWNAAISRLGGIGDGFTIEYLKGIIGAKDEGVDMKFIENEIARIKKRISEEDEGKFANSIQQKLERAAWVDLMCHSLETTLPAWIFKTISNRIDNPKVKNTLKKIKQDYKAATNEKTLFGSMEGRVRSYAARLLNKTSQKFTIR